MRWWLPSRRSCNSNSRAGKGRRGTALLCRDDDANFVRRLITNLAEQGQAAVQTLQIDGKTIAAQVLLFSGTMAYTWKTAFDQSYAKFSPGVVLIDRMTEHLFATTKITGIDSCSVESSFMAQIWFGRRAMADVLVAVGPGLSIAFWVEAARHVGRERLKQLRDRYVAFRASRQVRPVAESAATVRATTTAVPQTVDSAALRSAGPMIETRSPPLASHPASAPERPAQANARSNV